MNHIKVSCMVGILMMLVLLAACQTDPLQKAREQVPIGATRQEAIDILNRDAWYHQPCPNRITIDDLFFFNSHEWDKAQVVIVGSEPVGDSYQVFDISTFDEPNAWHAAYQDCLQRDKFE